MTALQKVLLVIAVLVAIAAITFVFWVAGLLYSIALVIVWFVDLIWQASLYT